jgi:hypothetical protein
MSHPLFLQKKNFNISAVAAVLVLALMIPWYNNKNNKENELETMH